MADLATQFVHTVYPFHFFEVLNNVFAWSYAPSCRVTHYMMISMGCGTVGHAIMAYTLCFELNYGFTGICWATGVMFFIRGSASVLLVKCGGSIPTF